MNSSGQITIPKPLRQRFGLHENTPLDIEVTRDGILIKPLPSHREQVNQWFKDEHGDELATLTTDQLMHLIH